MDNINKFIKLCKDQDYKVEKNLIKNKLIITAGELVININMLDITSSGNIETFFKNINYHIKLSQGLI